ncbi:helix-turn-helix domain-containing protein [Actinophytocola sp. NPDC049390]|uniref:helix-turn-helix domain-containing protein n=1 Tax=Actinophytocola sp. NPDC049390 TaxID=3363894 RepID=UPI0037A6B66B
MDATDSENRPLDVLDEQTTAAIARALGDELRRVREAKGWSRTQFVTRLPSKIGDRTLLAYEHGLRVLTVLRLLELCQGLGVPAPTLLTHALQRVNLFLANLVVRIDLRALVDSENRTFWPMRQWARNKLNRHPDGVAELSPASVVELADFMGCGHEELAVYLARFTPDTASTQTGEPSSSTA